MTFPKKPPKYRNKPVVIDGVRFASQKEARRWFDLVLMQKAGDISSLQRQISYRIVVNGVKICDYIADHQFLTASGDVVVEDVKGFVTPEFKLKQKLMLAVHSIDVVLV